MAVKVATPVARSMLQVPWLVVRDVAQVPGTAGSTRQVRVVSKSAPPVVARPAVPVVVVKALGMPAATLAVPGVAVGGVGALTDGVMSALAAWPALSFTW